MWALASAGRRQGPQQVAGAQVGEPGALGVAEFRRVEPGEHVLGVLPAEQPGQRVRPQVAGFRAGTGRFGGGGQPFGQGQIGQPDGALGRPHQQRRVRWQVGVDAQARLGAPRPAVHRRWAGPTVRWRSGRAACATWPPGFGSGASRRRAGARPAPRTPLPFSCREIRPRTLASSTASTEVIRCRIDSSRGSATARASTTSPTAGVRSPNRDSISSTRPVGSTGRPAHCQVPSRCSQTAVGQLLLDDVAQIQRVAPGQLPEPVAASGSTGPSSAAVSSSAHSGCPQRPHDRAGRRCGPSRSRARCRARGPRRAPSGPPWPRPALHHLVQDERRQVVEQLARRRRRGTPGRRSAWR